MQPYFRMICTDHPNIIRVIQSRILRLNGNVVHMGGREKCKNYFWEIVKETDFLGDLCVEERIRLKIIVNK
jgi:hypothetical protein